MGISIKLNDVDRRIWQEELDEFVPQRVFDVHTHLYRWEFNTDPNKNAGPFHPAMGRDFPLADWANLARADAVMMPGRQVHRLGFGFPFSPACDFEASNEFAAQQARTDPMSAALMLVEPSMTADYIEGQIDRHGFVGLKPYRFYSVTGEMADCRIEEFLPRPQIEVAHRRGLIITLHLSKRGGIGDEANLDDLDELTGTYPGVKWILAHCGRSYSSWAIERAAGRLRKWNNVWWDTSSVCESDAFDALFSAVGVDRVMYGSDDFPVGVQRGKYIAFGYAWAFLSETNHTLDLSHCNPTMTLTRYEQLRAMRQAARRHNLSQGQREALFFDTAARLIDSVRG